MRTPLFLLAAGLLIAPSISPAQVGARTRSLKDLEQALVARSTQLTAQMKSLHALQDGQLRRATRQLEGQKASLALHQANLLTASQGLQLRSQAMLATASRSHALAGQPLRSRPPAPWVDQDPADSLYRAARHALNRSDYWRSVELFRAMRDRYPKSSYTPDAYYWESYALYRRGNMDALRMALETLALQERLFPNASTRSGGDARSLETRIRSALARTGDARAATALAQDAMRASLPPTPPAPAVAPVPSADAAPRPLATPLAPRPVLAPGYVVMQRDECRAQEDDIQAVALNALIQMDEERAVPILEKVLARRDEGSTCLRRKAVFIVGQHGTPRAEAILLSAARSDPDKEVRGQAVFWLSQVESEHAVTALDSILFNSTDPDIQDKALFALSQHDSPTARRGLRRYVERSDVSAGLREKALFWLGQSDDPADAAFLRSMYGRVREPQLKQRILFAVAQSDATDVSAFLLQIARDANEPMEVRKQAIFWMGQRDETTGAQMASIYGTFSDAEMKEHIIFTLAQRDDKASIDKLIDIARREPDQALRKKAIFWLGQSDDPRVPEVLGELLVKP